MGFFGDANMSGLGDFSDSFLGLSDVSLLPLSFDGDVAEIASWVAARQRSDDEGEDEDEDESRSIEVASVRTDSASESGSGVGIDLETGSALLMSPVAPVEVDARRRKRVKGNKSKSTTRANSSATTSLCDSVLDDPKPRKPTYLVRKEEKDGLNDEIRLLEARLELLKLRAGIPTGEQKRTLASVQASNFEIEEAIHANLLGVARFHSLLSRHLHSIPVNPMKTFIHLSKDVAGRSATLRAMRTMKLRRAQELANNRMTNIDPTRPYSTEERYISEDGTYHCKRLDILPFEGLRDARQLFDALIDNLSNMETSMSSSLGEITIREDLNAVDPTIWNHRLVTASASGFMQELNTVGFSQFIDEYEPHNGAQHGIVAADSVDIDDLYPYQPSERVRKDVTAAITVSEVKKPGSQELVVVLRRCVFLSLQPAQFPVPASVVDEMRSNIAAWCTVMSKCLQDTENIR